MPTAETRRRRLSSRDLRLTTRLRRCQKTDSQNASRPGRHQIGRVGEIISESWARSNRNTRARSSESARKRHILVDTLGLLLNVVVHPANVQDRDGARLVLDQRTRRLFPFIERIFADAGYQGAKTAAAIAKIGSWKLEIVKRNEPHRFVVLPKRWIVERTLAWISHNRRLARDFERYARSAAAFVQLAMIRIMLIIIRPTNT